VDGALARGPKLQATPSQRLSQAWIRRDIMARAGKFIVKLHDGLFT